jgi:hypothetical protein
MSSRKFIRLIVILLAAIPLWAQAQGRGEPAPQALERAQTEKGRPAQVRQEQQQMRGQPAPQAQERAKTQKGMPAKMREQAQEQQGERDPDDRPIAGWHMMTEQERQAFRERMRAARDGEEREQIRQEHHALMRERAQARGMELPEEPRTARRSEMMGQERGPVAAPETTPERSPRPGAGRMPDR